VVLGDEQRQLWSCLARLPERCQRLLRIVAAEQRPDYTRIAADLQMPVGSIGPTRGRCLDKLRAELTRTGGAR
jgi:DNA-directed RNA polymerase specialized sigma24 family protein